MTFTNSKTFETSRSKLETLTKDELKRYMRVFNSHCPSLRVDLRFRESTILDDYFERLDRLGIKPFDPSLSSRDIEITSVTVSEVTNPNPNPNPNMI